MQVRVLPSGPSYADVAKLGKRAMLKPSFNALGSNPRECGFDSHRPHHFGGELEFILIAKGALVFTLFITALILAWFSAYSIGEKMEHLPLPIVAICLAVVYISIMTVGIWATLAVAERLF